jgi:hypothetical protein
MPVNVLQPSLSPAAVGGRGPSGSGAQLSRQGTAKCKTCNRKQQQQEEQGASSNANRMLPNLRRCGEGAAIWNRTLRCRHGEELGRTATIFGNNRITKSGLEGSGFVNLQGQRVTNCERFSSGACVGILDNSSSCTLSDGSNAVGSMFRHGGGASMSILNSDVVGPGVIRSLSGTRESSVLLTQFSGRCYSPGIHSSCGDRQVSVAWKRRAQKDDCEHTSIDWNGVNNLHESRHSIRCVKFSSIYICQSSQSS